MIDDASEWPLPTDDEAAGSEIGVMYEEGEPLRVGLKEHHRDKHRWELDPASAEDYRSRSAATALDSEPILKMRHHDRYA